MQGANIKQILSTLDQLSKMKRDSSKSAKDLVASFVSLTEGKDAVADLDGDVSISYII